MLCCYSDVTEISCPTPELPFMATYNLTSVAYKSRVKYVCHQGYSIASGDEEITCQANGKWSGVTPKCESEYIYILSVISNLNKTRLFLLLLLLLLPLLLVNQLTSTFVRSFGHQIRALLIKHVSYICLILSYFNLFPT